MDLSGTSKPLPLSFMPNIDDIHADASPSNYDPFKFSHGLTGVDQRANYLFVNILIVTALIPAILAISFRIFTGIRNDRRRISVITSCHNHEFWEKDRYIWWGSLKRYFLYSPFWTKRHNRELRIPGVGSVGTLPTRPQLVVIITYVASNITYCVAIPEQPRAQKFAEFRGRCGALAAFNMIFTILFALRNNPFIWLLHISYDTFNLFHRWIARLVILQSLAHVSAFMYNAYQVTYDGEGGWHSISWVFRHSLSYQFGFAALIAMSLLMLHSVGPLRHAFYETFLGLHRIGIAVTVSGIYFHLAKHALPQLPWVYLFIGLLALEPLIRLIRILYYNFSWKQRTWTRVSLEALPGEATRVTFALPRSWNANPGSHVHVYLPRIALWSSHPFSVAWSRSSEYSSISTEKLPTSIDDLKIKPGPSSVSCVIRARAGMTQTLYNIASQAENSQVQLWGAVEGPYGGYHSLDSYGTVVLFAAGVGITHQLSFVQKALTGHNANTAATKKVLLIWCIPNFESIEWIRPWLEELGTIKNFDKVVRIRLYCSKPRLSASNARSLPTGLDLRLRRCDPQLDIDEEILAQTGAMVVSVCGPGGFSDSVRAAVRRRVGIRSIDFVEEAFSY